MGSRSPAGPRRLGTATRIMRIAVTKALCALREHTRPRPKSGKVRRSDTRPGEVCERAERSEGSDTTPVRNAPCFAVCALVCDPVGEGERVPAFTRESKRGPFVGEVEKRLGDKIYGGSFAGFSPSADVEGSQRTGKCMYIKARRNQGLRMRCSEQFHWQLKIVLWPREERPLFRRVCRCVRSCWQRRVCTHFHPQKRMWAVLQAIAPRAFLPCGTH